MIIAKHKGTGDAYSPEKMGFILLEVLVSVMILTVGLLAVLGAFSSSSKIIASSERYQIALQLAEQKLYEIETTPDDELREYGHGAFGDKYPEYSWDYDTKEEQSEFYSNEGGFILEPDTYKKIIVNVSVKERGKTQTPVTLVTYKTTHVRFLI
jgi:Tfp pilus assembly protein PilV